MLLPRLALASERPPPYKVKRHARKLSSCGFRVLVPDLYKGAVGFDKEEAAHLMKRAGLVTGDARAVRRSCLSPG